MIDLNITQDYTPTFLQGEFRGDQKQVGKILGALLGDTTGFTTVSLPKQGKVILKTPSGGFKAYDANGVSEDPFEDMDVYSYNPPNTTGTTPKETSGLFNTITRKSGTKATRNNNPGNITAMGGLHYGAIGIAHSSTGDTGDHKQLVFKTPFEGFAAMHKLLSTSYSRKPLGQALKTWQTNTEIYRSKIHSMKKQGVDLSKKYSELPRDKQRIVRAVTARYEGYKGRIY